VQFKPEVGKKRSEAGSETVFRREIGVGNRPSMADPFCPFKVRNPGCLFFANVPAITVHLHAKGVFKDIDVGFRPSYFRPPSNIPEE
jgi:hypothetical protein